MKVLVVIALLSAASALPRPGVLSSIDFRPLMVPKEIIEAAEDHNDVVKVVNAPDYTVKFVDNVAEGASAVEDSPVMGTAVNFVDNIAEGADFTVKIVDNAGNTAEEKVSAGSAVKVVDLPTDQVHSVRVVDSPINEESSNDVYAVNFVDTAEELVAQKTADDAATAVHIVDIAETNSVNSPISFPNDGLAVKIVDTPISDANVPMFAVHIVNGPLEPIAHGVIIIENVFAPIRPSELEAVRVMDLPVKNSGIRYPPKVYENPLLR